MKQETSQIAGWEEAIRKGLVSIRYALEKNLGNKTNLWFNILAFLEKRYLGKKLIENKRTDAGRKELEQALSAYKKGDRYNGVKIWKFRMVSTR